MPTLNHLNLTVKDVPALARFFSSALGFTLEYTHPAGHIALLRDTTGFLLTLMFNKNVSICPYPSSFHVGLLMDTPADVEHHHANILAAGYTAPAPAILTRGGPKTFGFYCPAPSGVLVEVSTFNLKET